MEEILEILERDARTKPSEIAAMTGLSEKEVKKKIKELESQGVIRKYQALVDWERTGREVVYAFIEVKVTPERGVGFDAIAKRIYKFPEVHSVYLMSGAFDLGVFVEGKSMKEVAYFVAEKLAPIEHVLSTATHFVLKTYKLHGEVLEEEEKNRRQAITL